MDNSWSGAIVYEWIEEDNNYGLISYGPTTNSDNPTALDGYPRSGTPSPVSPDYSNLKSHWATLNPTGVSLSAYTAQASSLTPIACPSSTPNGWIVNPTASLPSLGQTLDLAATSTGGLVAATATPSATKKGVASGSKKISKEAVGMGVGLFGVLLGFSVCF